MNPQIPEITAEELEAKIRSILPNCAIQISVINPEYRSWALRVTQGRLDIEFVWGPLSGFGGRDMARPGTPDDTPFDYADEMFGSVDEALGYLRRLMFKVREEH